MKTRVCSPVVTIADKMRPELSLEERDFTVAPELSQRSWPRADSSTEEELKVQIKALMAECRDDRPSLARNRTPSPAKETRQQRVNRQRQQVAGYLRSNEVLTMRGIASKVGCSYELVRTVKTQIKLAGRTLDFKYNNLHTEEDERRLDEAITQPQYRYFSTRDFKRVLNQFSMKKIRRQLKVRGKKWERMARTRVQTEERMPDKDKMLNLISHAVRAHQSQGKELLFTDEMKFPMNQTPNFIWKTEADEGEFYNNRPDNLQLTAIVLCSTTNFLSVQFFLDEVTAVDFLYFMQEAISRLPNDKEYSILLDNATWHKAAVVRNTDVWRFLAFNEPHQFRVNLIENSFSGVRQMWRQRAHVDTLGQEMALLVDIFSDARNKRRFKGYYFNHLRAMLSYFRDY